MGLILKIVFRNDKKTYFPSQWVSGKIQVITDRSINCEGLYLMVEGFAQVVVKKSNSPCSRKKAFGKEVYYNRTLNVWRDNTSVRTLNTGEHSFNFKFPLPKWVPASFTSKNGNVTYRCLASLKLHRSWHEDTVASVPFFVKAPVNLNQEPLAKEIINEVVEKKLSGLLGRLQLGCISLKVNVSRSGYIPGEDIVIYAKCNNHSIRIITELKAEILQETIFIAGNDKKFSQHIVASKKLEFGDGKTSVWMNEKMRVPDLIPSGLKGCNIIDLQYRFVFKVLSKRGKTELETSVPLIIGSVPLQQDSSSVRDASSYPRLENWNSPRKTLPSAPPSHLIENGCSDDPPPPSYQETFPGFSSSPR